jgi:hypothetical protein
VAITVAAADVGRVADDVGEFIAFHTIGARFVGELRCSDCGYGIVSRGLLPTCPMCRGQTWEESPWRPFTCGPGPM